MVGKLIVARHHESVWNKRGLWTGEVDIGLTTYGFEMSKKMGKLISDLKVDQAFASTQVRSMQTLFCMEEGKWTDVPIIRNSALNERDYGIYTGKNKMEMLKILGEEEFNKLRRAWDYPVPEGETLKMVYERVVPFYLSTMLPILKEGKNALMVAHGNSIRALMKYIEKLTDEDMMNVEMLFGAVVIYDLNEEGYMIDKEVREIPNEK